SRGPRRPPDRAAHLRYAAVGERERKARIGLQADAHVLEVLAEERLVHAFLVARVLLPLRERRTGDHFRVGFGFRGLRYPLRAIERYREVSADSRHTPLIRQGSTHPSEAVLDCVGHPTRAP